MITLERPPAVDMKDIEIARLRDLVKYAFRQGWQYGAAWDFTKDWGEQASDDWHSAKAKQLLVRLPESERKGE